SAPGPSPSRSMSTEVSTAIMAAASELGLLAGLAAAQLAHDVVGARARGQAEAPAHARDRVARVLAQYDPPAVELDLQDRALHEAQRVAHGLGQRDLSAFGDGGFHGVPRNRSVRTFYAYFLRRGNEFIPFRAYFPVRGAFAPLPYPPEPMPHRPAPER